MKEKQSRIRSLCAKGICASLFICIACGLIVALSLVSGCAGSESKGDFSKKLNFNVSSVFSRTVGSDSYVVLTLDLSTLDTKLSKDVIVPGDIVYIRLYDLGGYAQPTSFSLSRPIAGLYVEGRIVYVYTNSVLVSYDFDTVRLPTGSTRDPQSIVGASVRVATNGSAVVESLIYRK